MPHTPSILQQVLRALVLLLDGFLGARAAFLRARLATLPENHKHRAALEAEIAKLQRARALIANPDSYDCPRFRGMLAEVARVRNDLGRRAVARRRIYPWLFFALPAALPAPRAELAPPDVRCTPNIVVR